jgi:hypothetical protein
MALGSLLIFFSEVVGMIAFWLLQMPQVDGWLRLIPQADN